MLSMLPFVGSILSLFSFLISHMLVYLFHENFQPLYLISRFCNPEILRTPSPFRICRGLGANSFLSFWIIVSFTESIVLKNIAQFSSKLNHQVIFKIAKGDKKKISTGKENFRE